MAKKRLKENSWASAQEMAEILKLNAEAIRALRRLDEDPLPADALQAFDWADRHGFKYDEYAAQCLKEKYPAKNGITAAIEPRAPALKTVVFPPCPHCGVTLSAIEGWSLVTHELDIVYASDAIADELTWPKSDEHLIEHEYLFVVRSQSQYDEKWSTNVWLETEFRLRYAKLGTQHFFRHDKQIELQFIARAAIRSPLAQRLLDHELLFRIGMEYQHKTPVP